MLNKLVLDVETQKSFSDVGGRNKNHLLKISVAVAYSYPQNKFLVFEEPMMHRLAELIQAADQVIGYNLISFDYEVMQPYMHFDLKTIPTLDMLVEVEKVLGHRVKLDSLAEATLNVKKTGDGLDAIRYWQKGELQKLKDYCVSDVKITRDLYEYVRRNESLKLKDFFKTKEFKISFSEAVERKNKHQQKSLF